MNGINPSVLKELTRLTVINIVDNETDGMSSPCACMQPIPNIKGRDDRRSATYTQEIISHLKNDGALDMNALCHAAHGLSLLLVAEYEEEELLTGTEEVIQNSDDKVSKDRTHAAIQTTKKYLLFDGGPDPTVWSNNAKKCGIPLKDIGNVVLSHYHIDHSNGLRGAVQDIVAAKKLNSENKASIQGIDSSIVVDMHQSQIKTRGFKVRGRIYPMIPDNPSMDEIESLGAKVELHKKAHIVDGCFYVSGKIPRNTDFETGLPGHFRQIDSKMGPHWVQDEEILDERYLACKMKGRGIVVFSACSHAGIVNVCNDAVEKLNAPLTAALGGFHLAGSSVEDRINSTVEALKKLDPDILLAGHCTGWRAKALLAQHFPYNFQPLAVGGKYVFNSKQSRAGSRNEKRGS